MHNYFLELAKSGAFSSLDTRSPTFAEDLKRMSEKLVIVERSLMETMESVSPESARRMGEILMSKVSFIEWLLLQMQSSYKKYMLVTSGEILQVDKNMLYSIINEVPDKGVTKENLEQEKARLLDMRMQRIVDAGKYPLLPAETPEQVKLRLDGVLFILMLILDYVVYDLWLDDLSTARGGEIIEELLKDTGDQDKENGK